MEKFMKTPYWVVLMSITTAILSFFGFHLALHIWEHIPSGGLDFNDSFWFLPATLSLYSWLAFTFVCFIMVFTGRPVKLWSNIATVVVLGLSFLILLTGIGGGGSFNAHVSMVVGGILVFSSLLIWGFEKSAVAKERKVTNTNEKLEFTENHDY